MRLCCCFSVVFLNVTQIPKVNGAQASKERQKYSNGFHNRACGLLVRRYTFLVEVKGISKRRRRPRVLQVGDAWRVLDKLVQPYRTMVLIALCFGLRISEILGLRWTDFDFKRLSF
jgi:integrase